MLSRLKNSYPFLVLCIFCIVFVVIKFATLNTPYFWDEAWVYAPAIKELAKNGISLLPDALSDTYSRGHPLLFFTTGAIWVKLFGSSLFAMHLYALTIAISFVLMLFYVVQNLFDSVLALIVASLTLVQPIFVAQSGMVLPEVFLSLWAVLTIYHFVKGNNYYYFLFGMLMVLTKESGIVIIASLMLYQAVCFFTGKINPVSFKLFFKNTWVAFSPVIPFMIFLWIQHYQRGYYFYPEHISMLNFNWHDFQERLKHCYDYVFEHQDRMFLTWSFLIAFGLFYKPIPLYIRCFIVLGLIACVKIFFRYWALPDWLMIIYITLFTSAFYYFMHIKNTDKENKSNKFLSILFIMSILYLVFSCINFFTNRYLLILIPCMILYFAYYIKTSLQYRVYISYAWALALVCIFVSNDIAVSAPSGQGDDSPQYIQAIKLEKSMIGYLESRHLQKHTIYCSFTMCIALHHPEMGFLSDSAIFDSLVPKFNNHPEYVIFTNIDYDSLWLKGSDTLPHYRMLKRFDFGGAHGKIFKRSL